MDFYCAEERIAVEIDGSVHDSAEQMAADESRQQAIEAADIRFVRLRSELVMTDLAGALRRIGAAVGKGEEKRHPSPLEGEGQVADRRPG